MRLGYGPASDKPYTHVCTFNTGPLRIKRTHTWQARLEGVLAGEVALVRDAVVSLEKARTLLLLYYPRA